VIALGRTRLGGLLPILAQKSVVNAGRALVSHHSLPIDGSASEARLQCLDAGKTKKIGQHV